MPLSPGLSRWLRGEGYDAVHAGEIGLYNAKDTVLLDLARREEWIVITSDLDFPRLLALSKASGPGLILFRGGDWSDAEAISQIGRVIRDVPGIKLSTGILTIDHYGVRWRSLPINGGN
jgi:predicted nuclease of predicted toxin-antitoxin system